MLPRQCPNNQRLQREKLFAMNRTMQQFNAAQGHHHLQINLQPKIRGNISLEANHFYYGQTKKGTPPNAHDILSPSQQSQYLGSLRSFKQQNMRRHQGPLFTNLSVQRIRGFLREENALRVLFFASTAQDGQRNRREGGPRATAFVAEVKCIDKEKAEELLAVGLGNLVVLYNVKVTPNDDVLVTATSGIRAKQPHWVAVTSLTADRSETHTTVAAPNATAVALVVTSTTTIPTKWTCLLCTFNNYASTSVCFSCNSARQAGPVLPLLRPFRAIPLDMMPLIKTVWTCKSCFARKNSPWKGDCWKCGQSTFRQGHQKEQEEAATAAAAST
jgi:hypothetical protein